MLIDIKEQKDTLFINYMLMLGICFFFISGFIGFFYGFIQKK